MLLIKGGKSKIGNNEGLDNEKPSFYTEIKPFYLDENPVTVADFRLFVKINAFVTDAEKYGEATVYDTVNHSWINIKGANWQYPMGLDKPKAKNDEPVRQISWNDAKAYATWLGKRLPTEYELEYIQQNLDKFSVKKLNGELWQWCENWFSSYEGDLYYEKQINREKTLKAGQIIEKDKQILVRPSLRLSALPSTVSFSIGFRCAKDIK